MENISDNKRFIKEFNSSSKQISYLLIGSIIVFISIIGALKYRDYTNQISTDKFLDDSNAITLDFEPNNFPTLQLGHYALWLKSDTQTEWTLFKRFNSIDNNLVSLDGTFFQKWTESIPFNPTKAKVSIEVEGDRDTLPNTVTFIEGDFQNVSELKFDAIAEEQIGDSSTFILASPTDGNSEVNELSGIWFINSDKSTPSLNLPSITTENWSYQARVIDSEDHNMLLGSFTNPTGTDSSNTYSETSNKGFATPGEDLFTNLPGNLTGPLNLASGNYSVVISLEPGKPGEDFTSDSYFIKIYESKIPLKAKAGENIGLKAVFNQPQLILSVVD